jgi:hypothetical protein
MMNDINLITESEFQKMKQSIITKLLEKSPNIYSDTMEKYYVIANSEYNVDTRNIHSNSSPNECNVDFICEYNRKQSMCDALDSVKTKDKFVEFVKNIIESGIRSTILIEPKKP